MIDWLINCNIKIATCRQKYTQVLGSWTSSESLCLDNKLMMTSRHKTLYSSLALCEGNPPVTDGFPSQMTSYVERFFFLIVAWPHWCTNSRVTGYLRRQDAPMTSLWFDYVLCCSVWKRGHDWSEIRHHNICGAGYVMSPANLTNSASSIMEKSVRTYV